MHEGFQKDDWNKLSSLMWASVQPHAGKKKLRPEDFNPTVKRKAAVVVSMKEAKGLIEEYILVND